ncbi:interferon epsilon [Oncorhynchus mykiss]|uniref:Type I interferon f1 n=2 Tax=Oncorhynchus mykiss TaxID=8022 RepID=T2K1S8_ONCMY|nr:interferon epsilon [Oncorhynchus mykiss]CCV17413.1 type I interferon f1 [Oncorhynchus mykiss]
MATLNVSFVVHLLCIIVFYPAVYAKCSAPKVQKYYLSQTHQTLNDLAEERLPRGCIPEAERLRVQRPALPIEEGEKVWTLRLAFQLASELFQQNLTLVKWNSVKLRDLQDLLARQNMTYSECVRDMSVHLNLPIKNYFKELEDFLSHERFSACSWELVRAEMGSIISQAIRNAKKHV